MTLDHSYGSEHSRFVIELFDAAQQQAIRHGMLWSHSCTQYRTHCNVLYALSIVVQSEIFKLMANVQHRIVVNTMLQAHKSRHLATHRAFSTRQVPQRYPFVSDD